MMQGSSGQGNQNGQKQGGLSWTQSPGSNTGAQATNQGGAKPVSQVPSPLMPQKTSPAPVAAKSAAASAGSANNNKKSEHKQGGAVRTAGIFVAGAIVGLIVGWGWFSLGDDTGKVASSGNEVVNTSSSSETSTAGATQGNTQTSPATSGSRTLAVSSQQSAGLQVEVSNVSVTVPTWVVIFESSNGKVGNALGAKMFFAGESSGTVELLRATTPGQTYFAGEYVDDGDHIFSKQNDTQITTVTGAPMFVEFSTR